MRCKVARREDQTAGALVVRDACHRVCLGNTKLPPFFFFFFVFLLFFQTFTLPLSSHMSMLNVDEKGG
jgi:hypothetical protein